MTLCFRVSNVDVEKFTEEKPEIQKLYSLCFDDGKSRISLETAVERLSLKKEERELQGLSISQQKILIASDQRSLMRRDA